MNRSNILIAGCLLAVLAVLGLLLALAHVPTAERIVASEGARHAGKVAPAGDTSAAPGRMLVAGETVRRKDKEPVEKGLPRSTAPPDAAAPVKRKAPVADGTPTPESIAGKRVVGRIDAKSGQVIENLHVINPDGPCIVVARGLQDVVIRNNEIGPCGAAKPTDKQTQGVLVLQGAHHVTITRNVIHDVSGALHAYQAMHPIVFDRNFVYNIRGPYPAGSMISLHTVTSGSGRTKITCNVSDAQYGPGPHRPIDHISIMASSGSADEPIEIAYNRIRGGFHKSGSGMMLGDLGGGAHIWAHHNTVVHAANVGIGVAGGNDILIEDNRVDNRGADAESQTHQAFGVRGFSACKNIEVRNNRGIARLWVWNGKGETASGYGSDGKCANVVETGNTWNDTSLKASMFDEPYPECE